jgi:uncharacterized protein (DUF433 family)
VKDTDAAYAERVRAAYDEQRQQLARVQAQLREALRRAETAEAALAEAREIGIAPGVSVMRGRCGGHPTLTGTRLRTSMVAVNARRHGVAWCCDAWGITAEQVRAAVEYEGDSDADAEEAPTCECGKRREGR